MRTDQAIARLLVFHEAILIEINAALVEVGQPGLDAQADLAARRWRMVRLLREYQIFKHVEIFDPAINTGSPHHVAAARRLKVNCIVTGEAFQAHVQRWSSEAVMERWEEYRQALEEMSTVLREHIASERFGIEGLLMGSARTRKLVRIPVGQRHDGRSKGTDAPSPRSAGHASSEDL